MVTVNGQAYETREGETVQELLEELGYRVGVVAVEYNGEVLRREAYGAACLKAGDRLEVVCFVGGG